MQAGRHKWSLPIVILIQIIVTFSLLEVGIRIVKEYHRPTSILLYSSMAETRYQEDKSLEELLNRHFKGFQPDKGIMGFVTNSKSFRTKEYALVKPPDTYRILALGDSFTHDSGGVPYFYQWATKLQHRLSKNVSSDVEVLNLGWPGVGPKFQVRLWELEAGKLQADLVVFAFFIGNDFYEDQLQYRLVERGWLESSLVVRAIRNLYRLKAGAVENAPEDIEANETKASSNGKSKGQRGGYERKRYRKSYNSLKPTFSEEKFIDIETERMALCLRADRENFEHLFELTMHTILTLREMVTGAGTKFVVMIIPDEYQVNPEVTKAVLERTGRSIEDYDIALPQRRLTRFFERVGIDHIDLLPDFLETGQHESLYKLRDTHWNIRGNGLAADLLVDHLNKMQLSPYADRTRSALQPP